MTQDEIVSLAQQTVEEEVLRRKRESLKDFYDKVFLANLAGGHRGVAFNEVFDLADRYLKARDEKLSENGEKG